MSAPLSEAQQRLLTWIGQSVNGVATMRGSDLDARCKELEALGLIKRDAKYEEISDNVTLWNVIVCQYPYR